MKIKKVVSLILAMMLCFVSVSAFDCNKTSAEEDNTVELLEEQKNETLDLEEAAEDLSITEIKDEKIEKTVEENTFEKEEMQEERIDKPNEIIEENGDEIKDEKTADENGIAETQETSIEASPEEDGNNETQSEVDETAINEPEELSSENADPEQKDEGNEENEKEASSDEEVKVKRGYVRTLKAANMYSNLNDTKAFWIIAKNAVVYAITLQLTKNDEERFEVAFNYEGEENRAYIATEDIEFLTGNETLELMAHPLKDSLYLGASETYPVPPTDCVKIEEIADNDAKTTDPVEEDNEDDEVISIVEISDIMEDDEEIYEQIEEIVIEESVEKERGGKSLSQYEGKTLNSTRTGNTVFKFYKVGSTLLPESDHYYANNSDVVFKLSADKTLCMILYFSKKSIVENNYDFIILYDGAGNYVWGLTGSEMAGQTYGVWGDVCYIRLISDFSQTNWGFKVESVYTEDSVKLSSTITDANGKISVSWEKVGNADGYQIQRAEVNKSTGKAGTYTTIKTTTSNTTLKYKDTTSVVGKLYSYRVRAYVKANNKTYYTTFSGRKVLSIKSPKVTSGTPDATSTTLSITIKWSAVSGASKYEIYRSKTKTGTYEKIGTTTSTSYKDTRVERRSYYYKIKPYVKAAGVEYAGYSGTAVAVGYPTVPGMKEPVGLSANTVKIAWNSVANAAGYVLYRSTNKDSGYLKIASTTTEKSYTDKNAVPGKINYYKIRSYQKINGKNVYSDYSEPEAIFPLGVPSNVTITKRNATSATVTWSSVPNATGYEVFYSGEKSTGYVSKGVVSGTSYILNGINEMDEYAYVRVKAVRNRNNVYSKGNSKQGQVLMNKIMYRALIIGNGDYLYENKLTGTKVDARAMQSMIKNLNGTKFSSVILVNDATGSTIKSKINAALGYADCNDVSVFYYSGHGASDGALCGIDSQLIHPYELRQALDRINGKKVVLIDACHSGNTIGKNVEESFVNSFISAFEGSDLRGSYDLAAGGYYVITACKGSQLSSETPASGLSGQPHYGIFTRALTYGCGWDEVNNKKMNSFNADTNGDGAVNLNELYSYIQKRSKIYINNFNTSLWNTYSQYYTPYYANLYYNEDKIDQTVQAYPVNSTQILFKK